MTSLFDPLKAGKLSLKNRIVMAPLTRGRAGDSRIANDLIAEYYAQRANVGLIITEATAIAADGYGWKGAPAMYNDEQEAGWKKTTDAVHKKGGTIVLQLWHMGRVSHPDFLNGELPIAPSAIAAEGVARSLGPDVAYVVPRAMTKDDIKRTVAAYADGAKRAIRAGFDGVEIHGANGYLINQFLCDGSNTRTDEYGGSVENRLRFLKEVVEAVTKEIGADRTGLRLSTANGYNSMNDSNPEKLFTEAAKLLAPFKLAYLHVKEGAPSTVTRAMRKFYDGVIVVNEAYDSARAQSALDEGYADAVAFGVPALANPDLVERLRSNAPLNAPDVKSFYSGGAQGYTDYPFLEENRKTA